MAIDFLPFIDASCFPGDCTGVNDTIVILFGLQPGLTFSYTKSNDVGRQLISGPNHLKKGSHR